jgi:alanyl-tRNA synthetase
MQAESRQLERDLAALKAKLATGGGGGGASATTIGGHTVVIREVPIGDARSLREAGDRLINEQNAQIVLLAGVEADKPLALTAMVKGIAGVSAGDLFKQVAAITGSRGGGRADMAQGGGGDPGKLAEAFAAAEKFLRGKLE